METSLNKRNANLSCSEVSHHTGRNGPCQMLQSTSAGRGVEAKGTFSTDAWDVTW